MAFRSSGCFVLAPWILAKQEKPNSCTFQRRMHKRPSGYVYGHYTLKSCQKGVDESPQNSDDVPLTPSDFQKPKNSPPSRLKHEIPSYSVDWDFEWVRYISKGGAEQSKAAPKSLTRKSWQNQVRWQVNKLRKEWGTFHIRQLVNDWRLGIGILLFVSMLMAALSYSHFHQIVKDSAAGFV